LGFSVTQPPSKASTIIAHRDILMASLLLVGTDS
jgi:hypothetical protein